MRVTMFHLMPYPRLSDEVIAAHDSYWVTMPNSHYDPKVGHETYNKYLDTLEMCDELGFDGVAVNEHHQTPYGMMPSPIVIASALARRTKRVTITVLGSAFCLRDHPLTLAEEHAMIDNITGGRLITGFVRGVGAEYSVFGVNPVLSHERHYEAHDLVVQAWTRPGPFAFEGKHYHVEYVNVWPRPFQQPHPPIWCPSQGSNETIEWAAHPDRKYLYLQNFNPFSAAVKYLNYYREIARTKYGYDATSAQLGFGAPVYVADTDEQAMNEARPHIEFLFNKSFKMPSGMFFPPGYTSPSSMRQIVSAKSSIMAAQKTIETLAEQKVIIVGSPETVIRQLKDCHKQLGFSNYVAMLHFGSMGFEQANKNIQRFAKDVLPALQALDDRNYQGFEMPKAAAVQ